MKKYNVLIEFYYGAAWVEVEAHNIREAEFLAIEKLVYEINNYGKVGQIEEIINKYI